MGRPSSSSSSSSSSSKRSVRNLVGILKDKFSLLKSTSAFYVAVLRATTHFPVDPPPVDTVDDVMALANYDRPAASAVVDTLLRRLRGTKNAYVALKCQLTLHHILTRGSSVSKEQILLAVGPHHNLLNLSSFRDESDADTWELSRWVRWYAGVLEQGILSTGKLGFDFLSPSTGPNRGIVKYEEGVSGRILLRDLGCLVGLVEEISRSPESLHYRKTPLIHEVMKLIGEDYRMTMREILRKITIIEDKTDTCDELTDNEVNNYLVYMKRLEDCKEKVLLMFLNIKRNDGCWDLIEWTWKKIERLKESKECMRMVRFHGDGLGSIRLGGGGAHRDITPSRPHGKRWLDVAWNPLVVPPAC